MKKLLPFITFLSGTSGLTYELLYTRLISYYFGDLSIVIITVLVTVFLGLALGYKYSHKFLKQLWILELLLGIYAFLIASVFHFLGIDALSLLPKFLLSTEGLILLPFLLIFIPMFLVGFSIPILTIYANKEKIKSAFPLIYGLYAMGSALVLIALELFFLKTIGIIACLLIAGSLNVLIAIYIYFYQKILLQKFNLKVSKTIWYFLPFVLGILSMLFQFYFIEVTFEIYGTYISNFAFVLGSALLGITFGSYFATKTKLNLREFLMRYVFIAIIPFLFLSPIIYLWSELFTRFYYVMAYKEFFQFIFIFLTSFMMFSLFGAVVPLFLKDSKQALPKDVLFSNSLGNALGIFLAGFVLYPFLDLKYTLVIILLAILGIYYVKK